MALSALDPKTLKVERKPLFIPDADEITNVLAKGLKANFADVNVEYVESDDFSRAPFNLAAKGLNGNVRIVEVGSPGYLLPLVNRTKLYNLKDLTKLADLHDEAFVIGAGAGPHPFIGVNCEGIVNLKIGKDGVNQRTRTYKVNTETGLPSETILPENETRLALLGNLLMSNGNYGKVLKVHVKKRTGPQDFITSIRTVLKDHFKDKVVGLGGAFLIKEGRVHQHVMPDFSATPITNDADLNNWLKFYEMKAPLVAVGTLITSEYDLDLRVQHFHSFGPNNEGGHYHYDVTPEDVEYLGYFVPAEYVYRIDKPESTQTYGKD